MEKLGIAVMTNNYLQTDRSNWCMKQMNASQVECFLFFFFLMCCKGRTGFVLLTVMSPGLITLLDISSTQIFVE